MNIYVPIIYVDYVLMVLSCRLTSGAAVRCSYRPMVGGLVNTISGALFEEQSKVHFINTICMHAVMSGSERCMAFV